MESNSTEKVTISLKERRDILLSNPHVRMWVTRYSPREFAALEMYPEIIDDYNDYKGENLHCYQQMVKPLVGISDEDKAECDKIYEGNAASLIDAIVTGKEVYFGEESPVYVRRIIDYLRYRGYALPYGQWSVEQLCEFGIFKLIKNGQ